jgi:hypothetical protein
MRTDAFNVVHEFERALCDYTGAPHCVAVSSCTMALLLAMAWHLRKLPSGDQMVVWARERTLPEIDQWTQKHGGRSEIEIPKRTYVSVPMSIIHAGGWPAFRDEDWKGAYRLHPLPIWDSARRLRRGMYHWSTRWNPPANEDAPALHGDMVCLSFHWSKILGIQQGGAILLTDPEADAWLRRARFDGRREGVAPKDDEILLGWHAYLSPESAAAGLVRMQFLPDDNEDLPNDDYPDLSKMEVFK